MCASAGSSGAMVSCLGGNGGHTPPITLNNSTLSIIAYLAMPWMSGFFQLTCLLLHKISIQTSSHNILKIFLPRYIQVILILIIFWQPIESFHQS